MSTDAELARISRRFLQKHRVYRHRMKKVSDMCDGECIRACHRYCHEENPVEEFLAFRQEMGDSL